MIEAQHRTMVREEMRLLFDSIDIPFKERRNDTKVFPRGAWRVIDRAFSDHPKSESGKTRLVQVMVMAELQVRTSTDKIDSEIDRVCELVEVAVESWTPQTGYSGTSRKGVINRVEYAGDHPRIKDVSDGTVEGPVYVVLYVHCQVGKK